MCGRHAAVVFGRQVFFSTRAAVKYRCNASARSRNPVEESICYFTGRRRGRRTRTMGRGGGGRGFEPLRSNFRYSKSEELALSVRCSVATAAIDDGYLCGPEYIRILHGKTSRRLNSSSHPTSTVNTWYRFVQKLLVHPAESSNWWKCGEYWYLIAQVFSS